MVGSRLLSSGGKRLLVQGISGLVNSPGLNAGPCRKFLCSLIDRLCVTLTAKFQNQSQICKETMLKAQELMMQSYLED